MKVLAESTLTTKEQLTLPRAIRRLLDVRAGDSLVWGLDEQGHVTVEAGRPHTLADVRAAVAAAAAAAGPVPPPPAPVTPAKMKAGIAAAMMRKHAVR